MGIYHIFFESRARLNATALPLKTEHDERALLALEALGAHVMLADEHNVITWLNESMQSMLRKAEPEIRKDLPHFSVDQLVGANMNVFHKNPVHQHDLLARLSQPFDAKLSIGGHHFSLRATPLFQDGSRTGTAVEWKDNTEIHRIRQLEQELQQQARAQNAELGIIKTALNTVTSNVMLADADGKIIYANQAVRSLLGKAEADIRKVLPHFRADNFVGNNMAIFHKNPAHQEGMLKRLLQPYQANIMVGVRHFRLTAAPVFDVNAARLGTVVEWQDRTAEIKMEEAVDSTIRAAIRGDLDKQIDHSGYSPFLERIATGINQLINNFSKVLGDAELSLNALSKGDLCRKMTQQYEGRFNNLKTDINSTIDKLFSVMSEIEQATSSVKVSSGEISMGNLNLSQRTEEQAASLEETSAAMIEVTQTVEQNSKSASVANDLAQEARKSAEDGGTVVTRAIGAMKQISESSSKIAEIIGVIDEIAFQTNLLALNAAVEAARAGDQGRGFAVVADEVRNLASRSAKAAKEIKALITDSGARVSEGAELVNKSGETLDRIILSIKKVNDIVGEISHTSDEQSRALQEINKAVVSMDDMTQQNAALVEEAAAASESLHSQADVLSQLVQFFDTGNKPRR